MTRRRQLTPQEADELTRYDPRHDGVRSSASDRWAPARPRGFTDACDVLFDDDDPESDLDPEGDP